MKRHATIAAVTAAFLAGACADREPSGPPGPQLEIVDSRNSDRAGFYFRFPIRRLSEEGDVPSAGFNPGLSPTIRFWNCGPATLGATGCTDPVGSWTAVGTPLTLTSGTHLLDRIFVLPHLKEYLALWNTNPLNLDPNRIYRLEVLVGGQILGFADVDVVRRLRELLRVDRDDYVGLLQDGILPIAFWIGENVLCEEGTASCTSESVKFGPGTPATTIEFPTPDEVIRVDIPAGTTATTGDGAAVDEVTFNLELCDGIDADLPLIGQCIRITSLVSGGTATSLQLSSPVLISLCSFHSPHVDQEALITLHQQDGGVIRALPHVHPNCPEPVPAGTVGRGAGLLDALARLFVPRRLYASSRVIVLNQGGGGQTDFFGHDFEAASQSARIRVQAQAPTEGPGTIITDFQFALPVKMEAPDLSPRSGPVGSILSFAVDVTDARGASVLDIYDRAARVTFTVTDAEEETILEETVDVVEGVAVFNWTALAGTFTVTARGFGIASPNVNGPLTEDPDGEGPISAFDPFWPDFDVAAIAGRDDIVLGTGVVTFAPPLPDLVISSGPTITPTSAPAGATFALATWKIKNQGAAVPPASGGFNVVNVAYFLSTDATITRTDAFLGSSHITSDGMAAGQEMDGPALVFAIPTATAPGTYWFGILADQDNAVAESNETNNFASTPLTVAAPGAADLVVTSLTHSIENPTDADVIDIAVEVANVGTAPAQRPPDVAIALDIATEKDGTPQEVTTIAAAPGTLAPGATQLQCCLHKVRDPGVYVETATVDARTVIAESDETNNTRTDRYTVTAGPSVIFRADFAGDVVGEPPGPPPTGTWTTLGEGLGTVLVQTGLGDLTTQPVVLTRGDGAVGLRGVVVGRPPTARVFVLRFRAAVSADITTGPATVLQVLSSNSASIGFFSWDGFGKMQWNGDDTMAGWAPGVSRLFELTIDLVQRTTSLRIDGAAIAGFQDLPFVSVVAHDIGSIVLSAGDSPAAFDDIEIVRQ